MGFPPAPGCDGPVQSIMTEPLDRIARVLAQLVHDAGLVLLAEPDPVAHRHCVRLFNRVLLRVRELEPDLEADFSPLSEAAGAGSVRMRGRDLLVLLSASRSPDWLSGWLERLFPSGERDAGC